MNVKKPRGTSDILPAEMPAWRFVEDTCRKQAAIYGFSEIRFPTFESTELFARGVGGTTDIVQKEMYTFTDKDDRSMTLRPEGTACVCRSVVENGLYAASLPLKLYYLSNFFRYEKPQAGRTREFFQFGCECFGPSTPQADAEAILLGSSVIRELGIKGCTLHINSIGCADCRPQYRAALKEYFAAHYDELCDTCCARLETNPLRILDCKSPVCSAIAAGAPKTTDHLCDNCRAHYESLKSILANAGVDFVEDPRCVRGLDYYTGTVFEFVHGGIGAQAALGGGGRYNGLIAELGGPELPAIGFALGLSRLIMAMQTENVPLPGSAENSLYIAPLGAEAAEATASLCERLRARGVVCETDITGRSAKAQLKYADKSGHTFVAVIGSDELAAGTCELKNLRSGEKSSVRIDADELARAVKA